MRPLAKSAFVLPHIPGWAEQYQQEALSLLPAVDTLFLELHHVGGTSIPGSHAKPIIDMLGVVKDIAALDEQCVVLEQFGYECRHEYGVPGRRYFVRKEGELHTHHLHCYETNNPEIERMLMFRDYLSNNPCMAIAYGQLKQRLAPYGNISYLKGKETFFTEIDKLTGFDGCRLVYPYSKDEWEGYHTIRELEIFSGSNVVYDRYHPSFYSPAHYHFIMVKGTEVIGISHVEILDDQMAALRSIAVKREYQHKAYGSQLLKMTERWVIQQHRRTIVCHADKQAVTFYLRHGYTEMPFHIKHRHTFHDTVDMGKKMR